MQLSLVAEWYEYQGFFVIRNVKVEKRTRGGFDGEMDVVAIRPATNDLVHFECSMDAHSWTKREDRFAKAFKIAKRNIPKLFEAFELPPLRQIALIAYGGKGTRETLGGGELLMLGEFVKQIQLNLRDKRVDGDAVPEQFPIIRGIQFAIHYGMTLNWAE